MTFIPTRAAGLAALDRFLPNAGRHYADGRNHDHGAGAHDNVSQLSPYLRHRLVTEAEVVDAVRALHSPSASEKFVQEVLWRTYWKGWLELRPAAWTRYTDDLARLQAQTGGWRRDYDRAIAGNTGIDAFDAWAAELAEHGYLHNHARMWFASIWVFTLRLPWQLGAAHFMHHLVDGDPASNTLSWRWVAGLQTAGKTYLATASNIDRYTAGRFDPKGLATSATALTEDPLPGPRTLPDAAEPPRGRVGLLLTEEDLHPESLDLGGGEVVAVATVGSIGGRAGLVTGFVDGALGDGLNRAATHFAAPAEALPAFDAVVEWARRHRLDAVVTAHAPVGPTHSALAPVAAGLAAAAMPLTMVRRDWDSAAWPLARRGFFAFREQIGALTA